MLKFKNRREYLLSQFPECVLNIWFGDSEEKRNEFGNYLIAKEEEESEYENSILLYGNNSYDEKLEKMMRKPSNDMKDLYMKLYDIQTVEKKKRKEKKRCKFYEERDIGIARYLNGSRYSKKYLNKDNYRKELKKIANAEKKEIKDMRKLGYIINKDVDEELKKLKRANNMMKDALSDAYVQKHFLK